MTVIQSHSCCPSGKETREQHDATSTIVCGGATTTPSRGGRPQTDAPRGSPRSSLQPLLAAPPSWRPSGQGRAPPRRKLRQEAVRTRY